MSRTWLLLTQDFPPRPGGMARYYADLAAGLGSACTVAMGTWNGASPELPPGTAACPLPFEAARAHRPYNLRRAHQHLETELGARPRDVLLSGNIRPYGPTVRNLARRFGIPMVQIYHGNDLLRTARRWRTHLWKRRHWEAIRREAAVHVVNSRYTLELGVGLGLPRERLAVVPPEVDTVRFHPAGKEERRQLRERFGWKPDEVVTLFVGRLVERKGLQDLFAALPHLPAPVRLEVVGPGDLPAWKARADRAGAGARVRFHGGVDGDTLAAFYRAADLFAGPSRDRAAADDVEGFGIVFLEAAASGLPVLATRTGGIPEAVEAETGGILVPPEDPDALIRAWRDLAGNPEFRRHLGEGGLGGRARIHGPGSSARHLEAAVRERIS